MNILTEYIAVAIVHALWWFGPTHNWASNILELRRFDHEGRRAST